MCYALTHLLASTRATDRKSIVNRTSTETPRHRATDTADYTPVICSWCEGSSPERDPRIADCPRSGGNASRVRGVNVDRARVRHRAVSARYQEATRLLRVAGSVPEPLERVKLRSVVVFWGWILSAAQTDLLNGTHGTTGWTSSGPPGEGTQRNPVRTRWAERQASRIHPPCLRQVKGCHHPLTRQHAPGGKAWGEIWALAVWVSV